MSNVYGFIGCGNMGSALVRALAKTTKEIVLSDGCREKAEKLAAELGLKVADSNEALIASCDRVFLGVKPQMFSDMLAPLRDALSAYQPTLITMAAGLTLARVEEMAGSALPIIRIMPNTPVAVGQGTVLYCRNRLVPDSTLASFLEDMRFAGLLDELSEEKIDAACSLSGCGPAFVCQMIEALADGAVACGLPRDKALAYAAQTLSGTAELLKKTGQHPGALKDAVCSPAGSTIAGVRVLEERAFRGAVTDAVIAAYEKNKELGKK